ncbi:MAG: hypothetical protein A2355_10940 [Spirochaetes bacterium RIFOXYB1_FULL_32_8]|nr:MAG: hypothetical protein A2355_10940 [Spirochaetes bacterium RIFOXYB1_FULL_32_8]
MSIKDLKDLDLIIKIKNLQESETIYSDVIEQYAREIYSRYYHQAYNLSRYYGLTRHDAEDVVQDSFIKLFKNIKIFNIGKEFKPWFFKIILNTVRDKYREMKKYRTKDIEIIQDTGTNEQEEIFEELHIKDYLNSIINNMPEKLKSVLVLRIYAEMEYEMIASTLGVSIRQLHNRLNAAFDFVKKAVEVKK